MLRIVFIWQAALPPELNSPFRWFNNLLRRCHNDCWDLYACCEYCFGWLYCSWSRWSHSDQWWIPENHWTVYEWRLGAHQWSENSTFTGSSRDGFDARSICKLTPFVDDIMHNLHRGCLSCNGLNDDCWNTAHGWWRKCGVSLAC